MSFYIITKNNIPSFDKLSEITVIFIQSLPNNYELNLSNLDKLSFLSICCNPIKRVDIILNNLNFLKTIEFHNSNNVRLILKSNLINLKELSVINSDLYDLIDENNIILNLVKFNLILFNTILYKNLDKIYKFITSAILSYSNITLDLVEYPKLKNITFYNSKNIRLNSNFPNLKELSFNNDISETEINLKDSIFPCLNSLEINCLYLKSFTINYYFSTVEKVIVERNSLDKLNLLFNNDNPILKEFIFNSNTKLNFSIFKVLSIKDQNDYSYLILNPVKKNARNIF